MKKKIPTWTILTPVGFIPMSKVNFILTIFFIVNFFLLLINGGFSEAYSRRLISSLPLVMLCYLIFDRLGRLYILLDPHKMTFHEFSINIDSFKNDDRYTINEYKLFKTLNLYVDHDKYQKFLLTPSLKKNLKNALTEREDAKDFSEFLGKIS